MSHLKALRVQADRLGLYFDEADLQRVATLLDEARESVRSLGPQPTEWVELSYVFRPIAAAPKGGAPAG